MRASRRPRAALAGVAAVAAAALAPAAPAAADPAGSLTKASGSVQATLAWSKGDFGVRRPTLTISRGGAVASGPSRLFTRDCGELGLRAGARAGAARTRCSSSTSTPTASPRSSSTASPAARTAARSRDVEGWVGGQQQSYVTRTVRWGNGGYDLRDLDGDRRLEFVSADDRFSDAYTSHAASATAGPGPALRRRRAGAAAGHAPLPGRWSAATCADHRALLRRARRQRYDARGIVAAIVADLYLLRRPGDARATLAARTRSGDLGSARSARAYRRALLRDLHRWHYR